MGMVAWSGRGSFARNVLILFFYFSTIFTEVNVLYYVFLGCPMSCPKKTAFSNSYVLAALLALVMAGAPGPAPARSLTEVTACHVVGQVPFSGSPVEEDVPGLTNPANPFVFPPFLRGELRARPICIFSTKNEFNVPSRGISVNLDKDLEFEDTVVIVDCMARAQVARFSLRAHYDAWLTTFKSDWGHLNWPPFRLGGEVDLVNTNGLRFGADLDITWEQPVFSAVLPVLGTTSIRWRRLLTAGAHLAYSPPGLGGIAPSLETRVRWPLTKDSRITEFEIAAGATAPLTVLGTTGFRGGWRYTAIELRTRHDFELDLSWSGVFCELVYFY
jgi:hypothetical protein